MDWIIATLLGIIAAIFVGGLVMTFVQTVWPVWAVLLLFFAIGALGAYLLIKLFEWSDA